MNYLIIAFLWAAYCALHSYLISIQFTKLMTRLLKKYYAFYRLFYVIISIVLIIPVIRIANQLNDSAIITYTYPYSIIRYALIAGSLLMFFWAFFFDYDSLSFWGFRQIMNLLKIRKKESSGKIKKTGLLGLMRHPMYLALIIYLWCQTFSGAEIVATTVLTIYILIGTILEEKKLVLEFGEQYIEYQQQVPMLIPFIKIKDAHFAFSVIKRSKIEKEVKYVNN